MSNEHKGLSAHSADHFGDVRDHWWNADYLQMVFGVIGLGAARSVLDVGCGVGHWGRLVMRGLADDARMTGVDREAVWVEKAAEKASRAGLGGRAAFQVAAAESLPFADGTFDLVTCQTVLMHVLDPAAALAEMIRVTRPGGVVLVAEPTNVMGNLLEAIALGQSPARTGDIVRFQLTCQRGKTACGEGNDLIGETLPALFAASGLQGIGVRGNDRCMPMIPPYESVAERAAVEDVADMAEREIWFWNRERTQRYFAAGGGDPTEFDALWSIGMEQLRAATQAMKEKRFTWAGGSLFYLVWGRKP